MVHHGPIHRDVRPSTCAGCIRPAEVALRRLFVAVWICAVSVVAQDGPTHVRLTDQVLLQNTTRLGINLGERTYFDTGQMLKNLLPRNPGFEASTYRSIIHCSEAAADECIEHAPGSHFTDNFWQGASYEVILGPSLGRHGKVLSSGAANTGGVATTALRLDHAAVALAAGDWIEVTQQLDNDPTAGWWPHVENGARFVAETRDLSPHTLGHRALRFEANGPRQRASLAAYFDTLDGHGTVRLDGRYRLSFRARSLDGARMLHIRVSRNQPGLRPYAEQLVFLKPQWDDYQIDMPIHEAAQINAVVEVDLVAEGATLLLDDVSFARVDGDAANGTVFRDEVLAVLRELHPGVLRQMSGMNLAGPLTDLLGAAEARRPAGYNLWFNTPDELAIGIPEFLALCRTVGAEPWITLPMATTTAEARLLAEYLAGDATTAGGQLRVAGGQAEPWTNVFPRLHLELGNETWNAIFNGANMPEATAYGRRSNIVFRALRAALPAASQARVDLVVGAWTGNPDYNRHILDAASVADTFAIAPYLQQNVTRWQTTADLFGGLMAEPEALSRGGLVRSAQLMAGRRPLAVYEVNLHTTEGHTPVEVLDRFTPSAAAGVAVAGHMLRMMRDAGARDQMLFTLAQTQFRRADGVQVRLWGGVVEMTPAGRRRPQFLAVELANHAIGGDLVRVAWSGEMPTHDVVEGNNGVRLPQMHELDAYGFRSPGERSLVLLNYSLTTARTVVLDDLGLSGNHQVTMERMVSPSPDANNESTALIRIEKVDLSGNSVQLEPCSMVVVRWQEPGR